MTLKLSQGYQTYNDNVDPKQGYNHAKLERFCFSGAQEKANVKVFSQTRKYANYLPWLCAQIENSGILMIYLTKQTIVQSFNLIG